MNHALIEKIVHWFMYHPPKDDEQREAYQRIRVEGRRFAETIAQVTPECPDQTVAIRCIREAVMWANAAIANEGR